MVKAKSDENDETAEQERNSKDEADEKSGGAEDDDSEATDADLDSSAELTPVRPKIGESKDNLRQRSDYFQKRRS